MTGEWRLERLLYYSVVGLWTLAAPVLSSVKRRGKQPKICVNFLFKGEVTDRKGRAYERLAAYYSLTSLSREKKLGLIVVVRSKSMEVVKER